MIKGCKIMSEFRGFIAVDIKQNNDIESFIKEIKNSGAIIKLVESKNIHITLKFLGDINDKNIDIIEDILKNATINIKPFIINLEGVGVFPNENYIKIIWIGIKKTDYLNDIFNKINHKLNSLLSINKQQKFIPHITIGRVKSSKNNEKILEIIEEYKDKKFTENLVDSIKLKKSELTPKGPIYSDVIKIKL